MAWLSSMAAALAIGWGTRETFIAGVVLLGVSGILARSRRRPGRPMKRGTVSLDGACTRLPDAPRREPGDRLRALDTAWWPVRATRGGRSPASRSPAAGRCSACTTTAVTRPFSSGSRPRRAATASTAAAAAVSRPPTPWPRRGLAAPTWPAFKACEPHVVLIGLTAMVVFAIVAPALGDTLRRGGVLALALLAPSLAGPRGSPARRAACCGRGRVRPLVPAGRVDGRRPIGTLDTCRTGFRAAFSVPVRGAMMTDVQMQFKCGSMESHLLATESQREAPNAPRRVGPTRASVDSTAPDPPSAMRPSSGVRDLRHMTHFLLTDREASPRSWRESARATRSSGTSSMPSSTSSAPDASGATSPRSSVPR